MKAFLAVMGGAVGLLLATTYAAAQDTKSCEAGDAKACIAAGNALIAKDNPNPDMPRGKQLFERACNLGNPSGCTLAGQLYLASGLGLVRDTPKGLALLNKGCSGGEGYACHLLGSAYDAGSAGLAVDKEKAISYFSSACTLGKENSCNVVHNIFLDEAPAGRARPHELAVVLGRACENGLVSQCAEAAVIAYDGGNGKWPQAIDWQLADRNALAGCKNRVVKACLVGEHIFSNPASKGFDLQRGYMYSDANCRLGTATGCYNKGNILILQENYPEVAASFAAGCKLGNRESCTEQQRWAAYAGLASRHGSRDAGRMVLLDRVIGYGDHTGAFMIAINDFRSEPVATYVFDKSTRAGKLSQLRDIDLTAYSLWNTAPEANRVAADRETRARIADHNRKAAAAEAARRAQVYANPAASTRKPVGSLGPNARFLVCHRDVNGLCDYKVQDGL